MKKLYFNQLLTILISFIFASICFAEGTAQLSPILPSDNTGVIQLWANNDNTRNTFTYGSENKLQFTICDAGEVAYLGVNYDAADITGTSSLWYRIISPSNTVVFPIAGGWQKVTNTGAGSIATWTEAVAGPGNISGGSGGYTPLSFTPDEPGEFYIEFYRNSVSTAPANTPVTATIAAIDGQEKIQTRLRFFDLTITNSANGTRIPGRLFSKLWDLNTNGSNNPFSASMYAYTTTGIVNKINFNGIRSTNLVITCNEFGVSNTGDKFTDAQSVSGQSYLAQYKIFLANPDLCAYPTGIFGDIVNKNNISVTGTDPTQLCINVDVNKAGTAMVLLNFNEIPGYQAGTSDVLLYASLTNGTNCIPWECKDGLGDVVPSGTTLDMGINYFNGEYHLPLYNVANNPYGLIVSLVRPAGPAPLLVWNDVNLTNGTINLYGCATSLPNSGCHTWGSDVNGNIPAGNAPADWGLGKTINTTWYANLIKVAATYNVPGNFVKLLLSPATVSETDAPFLLTGGTPAGGTYSGDGITNNVFSPVLAGPGQHTITYTYTFTTSQPSIANGRTTSTDYTYSSTQQITVTSNTTTGIVKNNVLVKGIYPNPNNGSFSVVGGNGAQLTIFNATGQLIESIQITQDNQSIQANLKAGIYHYTIKGSNGNTNSDSFIVQ